MPFASALSLALDPIEAIEEACSEVIRQLGSAPDIAAAFFTASHTDAASEMARAIQKQLRPTVLVGSSAVSVVGQHLEVEEAPAITVWAGQMGGVLPARFVASRDVREVSFRGPSAEALSAAHTLVLLPDPFSFPVDHLVGQMATDHPNLKVVGGFASASNFAGGNRLILNGEIHSHGAVGFLVAGPTKVTTVVSQGCRPIGEPLVVTKAEGHRIFELGGKPAYAQLVRLINGLGEDERSLAMTGLHIGRVINENQLDFKRGDFLIRGVMGMDRDKGSVDVGDIVPVGSTVQFQVRDAGSAHEDLGELMEGRRADGALLFTCNGRGVRFFDEPHHDAALVAKMLDGAPVGGMFCAGEVGPVGDRSFVHGYTASLALFEDA